MDWNPPSGLKDFVALEQLLLPHKTHSTELGRSLFLTKWELGSGLNLENTSDISAETIFVASSQTGSGSDFNFSF